MRTVAVTGAASGIGAAIRARLEAGGARVIGIDLRGVEVVADLATDAGRNALVDGVARACDGRLDGAVACAGLGPQLEARALIVAVNYFGAVATLAGLRPLLARGIRPAAVAITSNSASIARGPDDGLVRRCLDGDEAEARSVAAELPGTTVYAASKLALARWVRRSAVSEDWAGQGVRLNAVAPGPIQTPLLAAGLEDPLLGPAIRGLPVPLGGIGAPEQIATVVEFLLGDGAALCCGSVLFADGGTDALVRPDEL